MTATCLAIEVTQSALCLGFKLWPTWTSKPKVTPCRSTVLTFLWNAGTWKCALVVNIDNSVTGWSWLGLFMYMVSARGSPRDLKTEKARSLTSHIQKGKNMRPTLWYHRKQSRVPYFPLSYVIEYCYTVDALKCAQHESIFSQIHKNTKKNSTGKSFCGTLSNFMY